ncbi:glycoside hydrolase family 5 protein [Nocardioides sp.]|uniref:glycoside hydrolase family 5 protein n=1 Tax=Nocardioides sp. TaxID=35761 RepID=UPI0037847C6A
MLRLLTALVTSCAALAAGLVAAPAPATAGAAPEPRPLPRLHATTGAHAAVVDARGATVLLRGVNVNGLGEYFQANPDFETTIPLTRTDFREIARLGFNSVRLIISWSRLEPTRGAYDTEYVAQVRQAVDWAASYGLYVVLDMHQDAWGIAVDTPQDVTCPAGTSPSNGWDGAPAWATITDGASTCRPGERETAPAVKRAWQNFYDDTDGIQTELVTTWGRLAQDFAGDSTVAGFDLLNEPGFGTAAGNDADLGAFYGRAIDAIRRGERKGGGFSHIVFFEPNVLWSAFGNWTTPDRFTKDRNLVFAPHIYAESLSPNTIAQGFANAQKAAASYGVTVWSGEWGFFPSEPSESADQVERYARAEDRYGYGGAWWDWKQACGDPHMTGQPGGQPAAVSPSLVRYTCPDQVAQPVDPAFGDVLGRTVPRAVPGRTTRLTSDGRTGAFELAGRHTPGAQRCALRVWVPARFADERVRATGISHLRRTHTLGNTVLRGCVADTFRLRLG